TKMIEGAKRYAFEEDRRPPHDIRIVVDTIASGKRFLISCGLLFVGLFLGLHIGVFPFLEILLLKFIRFIQGINPVLLSAILFVTVGTDELFKVLLILLGVMPTIILNTYQRVKGVPQEYVTKGKTLAASDMEIAYLIILPRIWPHLLTDFRLSLKDVAIFLMVGESIQASVGLGFRAFILQRNNGMDIIIPIIIYTTLLLFLAGSLILLWIRWRYKWVDKE
ncbi:MAG: ABC transporter permease subunit, partial [Parcubacteria group bacterium]|nr:ABC transporter permease subunit [Parcubacteria group bacterium]